MAEPLSDLEYKVVNDVVMGGVSRGQVAPLPDGGHRFEGVLSLDQGGGFASIRSEPGELFTAGSTAVRVRVQGDGRTWSLTLHRADVPIRGGSYRVSLATRSGEVIEATFPLSDFDPTAFGRPVRGLPALDTHPARVDRVGFLLADGNPGPFVIEVLTLEAVVGSPAGPGPIEDLQAVLREGVPAFNAGYPGRCRDVYSAALTRLADQPGLTRGEQRVVREALKTASKQPAVEAAWTLRGAIDTMLATERP